MSIPCSPRRHCRLLKRGSGGFVAAVTSPDPRSSAVAGCSSASGQFPFRAAMSRLPVPATVSLLAGAPPSPTGASARAHSAKKGCRSALRAVMRAAGSYAKSCESRSMACGSCRASSGNTCGQQATPVTAAVELVCMHACTIARSCDWDGESSLLVAIAQAMVLSESCHSVLADNCLVTGASVLLEQVERCQRRSKPSRPVRPEDLWPV